MRRGANQGIRKSGRGWVFWHRVVGMESGGERGCGKLGRPAMTADEVNEGREAASGENEGDPGPGREPATADISDHPEGDESEADEEVGHQLPDPEVSGGEDVDDVLPGRHHHSGQGKVGKEEGNEVEGDSFDAHGLLQGEIFGADDGDTRGHGAIGVPIRGALRLAHGRH